MSTLFISHSSRDNDAVVDLQARLEERGYRSLFIDFDPQLGIAAGREWEQELYRQLKVCGALVALVSDHWLDSRWCFAELTQARALGKPVFALRIADCAISGLLADRHVVDVAAEGDSAWERLWIGLKRAGLDPRDVFERDPARPPYPPEEVSGTAQPGRGPNPDRPAEALMTLTSPKPQPMLVGAMATI